MALPNCGVYATAVIADVTKPIDYWMEKFREKFNFGARWKGVTNVAQIEAMLSSEGVKVKRINAPKVNLKKFVDYYSTPGVRYIVRTGYHMQVVVDGIVIDQHQVNKVDKFWGNRKRVTHVIEVK